MLVLDEKSIKNARITIILLTVNILLYFVFNLGLGDEWVIFFSQINVNIIQGEIWRLFTAMFFHAYPMHLFNNMLFLFLFGVSLESNYKKIEFIAIYFLSGLVGNLFSLLFLPPDVISLGASGCIFGLVGASIMSYISYDKSALLIGLVYLVLFLIQSMGERINTIAHLGGGIVGLLVGYLYNRKKSILYDYD
jgi:rhomboid protease GluP